MKPEHRMEGTTHFLYWKEEGIAIMVDRLYEDSHYSLYGEVTVKCDKLEPPHLHQARLNLTSTTARKTVVRALTERLKASWDDIIEQLCVKVLEAHRQGEDVIDLSEGEINESVEYLAHPLVVKHEPNVIFGDGGSGKSYVALYVASLTSLPENHCGIRVEPAVTLYLDWETNKGTATRRLAWIAEGLDVPRPRVLYRKMAQPLANDVPAVRRIIAEREVTFVIVDSAIGACGTEIEKSGEAGAVFQALRALGDVTSLIVTHTSKDLSGQKTPFGSVFWRNNARNVFELRKQQEMAADKNTIGFYHRKANDDKYHAPFALEFTFNERKVFVERTEIAESEDLMAPLTAREKIRLMLEHQGPMTNQEIMEETGLTRSTTDTTLSRGKRAFVKVLSGEHEGKWGLVDQRWG